MRGEFEPGAVYPEMSESDTNIKFMFDVDQSDSVFAAASPPADIAGSPAGVSGVPLERLRIATPATEAGLAELARADDGEPAGAVRPGAPAGHRRR
jgi:hypothetical protein